MKRSTFQLALALLLITIPTAARAANGAGTGPAIDPTEAFTVSGTVTTFTAAFGSGMPRLVVDDPALGSVEIGLGPLWFLQEAGFTAAVGDEVEALVATCDICAAETVALWVNNLTAGSSVVLRDDAGYPLWTHRQGTGGGQGFCVPQGDAVQAQVGEQRGGSSGNVNNGGQGSGSNGGNAGGNGNTNGEGPQAGPGTGNGPGAGAGPGADQGGQCEWVGPDMTQVSTVTGTVVSLEVGFQRESRPSVVLDVGGEEMQIFLLPYAPLAAAGFLIETGTSLEITYAPWTIFGGEEVLVALAVTDPVTGLTVQLRDPETGYPVTGGGGGFGPGFGYGPGPGDGN